MVKKYCPKCNNEVEIIEACGSVSHFCNTCNELKSSKVVLTEEENELSRESKKIQSANTDVKSELKDE